MIARLRVMIQMVRFIATGRGWWLAPILLGLLAIGLLTTITSATPLGPFLYPLF